MRVVERFCRILSAVGVPARHVSCRALASVVFATMALSACGAPSVSVPVAAVAPPMENSYRLGAGDKIRVSVFGEPNLTGEYQVDGGGTVTLPLIGRVKAAGLTSDELKKGLERNYREYLKAPDVSVAILNYRPFYIVGEVNKPGNYPYVSGITVINAVAIAGGFTYRANTSNFYVQRKKKDDASSQIVAEQTTEVRPGDVIIVRERYF
jgi:polysaccharide export outer membrane protein